MLNMGSAAAAFAVPTVPRFRWHLAVDTAAESPADLFDPADQSLFADLRCPVAARSLVGVGGAPRSALSRTGTGAFDPPAGFVYCVHCRRRARAVRAQGRARFACAAP